LYLNRFTHRLCGWWSNRTATGLLERALKLDGLAALVARFISLSTFEGLGASRTEPLEAIYRLKDDFKVRREVFGLRLRHLRGRLIEIRF